MLTVIDGPRDYLNDRPDSPYIFCETSGLRAYSNTVWLYEYALDAVEQDGGNWAGFDGALDIMSTYDIVMQDDETGETFYERLGADDLTPFGIEILDAAVRGEDVEPLFEKWRDHLYDEANAVD